MAQQAGALLAHFRMTERDVDYGVLAAVRVLDALRITSPSIGGPIDVYRLTRTARRPCPTRISTGYASKCGDGASWRTRRSTSCSRLTYQGPQLGALCRI